MELMARRRIMLLGVSQMKRISLNLVYGQGLSREYDRYSNDAARARTEDIYVGAREILYVDIVDTNYTFAIGAWDADTKANILYGGWDDPSYTSVVPREYRQIVKLVFKRTDNGVITNVPEGAFHIVKYEIKPNTEYVI